MRCDAKRLEEIATREQATLAGPWYFDEQRDGIYAPVPDQDREEPGTRVVETDGGHYPPSKPEREFIIHARSDVPDLLADLRDARELLGKAVTLLIGREPRLVREIRATLSAQGFAVVARTGNGPAYWTGKEWWFSSAHPGESAESAGVQRHHSMPAAWRAADEARLQVPGGWDVEVDPYPER